MIRPFTTEDTDALVTLWRKASEIAHPFLSSDFLDEQSNAMRNIYLVHAQTWVIEKGETPVGFIAMIKNFEGLSSNWEIGGLFVDPACQKAGLGRALVDFIVKRNGSLDVEVFCENKIGRAFYNGYGFVAQEVYLHEPSGQMTLKMTYRSA